jgi:glycosyltransferase involved in cell wall biosynthesis
MLLSGRKVPVLLSKRVGSYLMKRDPLHRFTYRHVSKVLAISEVIRRNVIATTIMDPRDVVTVHHGIDTRVFDPVRSYREDVRKGLGISRDDVLIGFVGRFSKGKGHDEFLQAAAILTRTFPHLRFAIVGEASYGEQEEEKRIRALCSGLGLDGMVVFTGFRRDIRDVMSAFDIFAFPSHAEAFGAVLIEAMAMECPVVSTNCDGVVDIVVENETGLYVSPGRADQLAEALAVLIKDPGMRIRFGKNGRRRVLERFDERQLIATIEKIYQELVHGK